MTRRASRPRLLLVPLVLAAVEATVFALWPSRPRVCKASMERVREGMTYDQVVAAVGGPPGDYTTRPVTYPMRGWSSGGRARDGDAARWWCDERALWVFFDDRGIADE